MIKGIIGIALIGVCTVLIPLLLARLFFGKDFIEWLADIVLERYTVNGDEQTQQKEN